MVVAANLWQSAAAQQKQKKDDAKEAWDLRFDATRPGPAQEKYLEDKARERSGVKLSAGEKRRRKRERQRLQEERRNAYSAELHRYRSLVATATILRRAVAADAVEQQ